MEEVKKNAEKFQQERKALQRQKRPRRRASKGNPESLQSPTNPLGGTFGTGTGLAE